MIQTYTPTHYSIVTAAAQDYEAFYEEEIRYRQIMGYPPVENLLAVLVSCEDEVLLETGCKYLKEFSIRDCSERNCEDHRTCKSGNRKD